MRSGVSRASVRSRRCWRMISCPAANEMRWVKPSIATVSPSRTRSATASRMEATFETLTAGSIEQPMRGVPSALSWLAGDLAVVHPARCDGLQRNPGGVRSNRRDRLAEDPNRGVHVRRRGDERRAEPNDLDPALQHEEAPFEAGPLHGFRELRGSELDADHQALAAD